MTKALFFHIVFFILVFTGCSSVKPAVETPPAGAIENAPSRATDFSEQPTWLLGYILPGQLKRAPHSEWYVKGFDSYLYNSETLAELMKISKDGLEIKIVLGTWCPDSRREVPRFMRILDAWAFPETGLTFIGVDNAKISPVEEYEHLEIERVPTFIFYKNNIEAGRIIENPVSSLEQDMLNILTGKQ